MNLKKFIIVLIVFSMLFSLQAIAATDVNDSLSDTNNDMLNMNLEDSDNYILSGEERDFEIDVDFDDIDYKENATFIVNAPEDADGDISLSIQGKSLTPVYQGIQKVVNGGTTFIVPNLNAGNYNVNLRLVNDTVYSDTVVFTNNFVVTPIDTSISASCQPIFVGDDAVVNVNLADDANGKVEVYINGEFLSGIVTNGVCNVIVSGLENGTYDAEIEYYDDINYNENSTSVSIKVFKISDYSVEIIVPDHIDAADDVIVEFKLPEDINGYITVKVDDDYQNATVSEGIANVTINNIIKGNHLIDVLFEGNEKYVLQTNTSSLYAQPVDLNITIENSTVKKGQDIILDLPADATGSLNVTFDDIVINSNVNNSKAVISTESIPAGVYSNVSVSYSGDNKYTSKNVFFDSVKVQTDDYSIIISVKDINVGEVENIVLALPEDISGNVVVNLNNKNYPVRISAGKGSVNITDLSSGKYDVNVSFEGNDKYLSKFNVTEFTVNKLVPEISIAGSTVFQNENIIFNLPEDATGNLNVSFGDKFVVAPVIDSQAIISTKNIPCAVYNNALVSYSGDEKYLSKDSNYNITIRHDNYDLIISADDINVGEVEKISLVLPEDINGNVIVNVAGKNYNVNVVNGKGQVSIQNLSYATYTATATFAGNEIYLNNSNTTTFKVSVKTTIDINDSDIIRGDDLIINFPKDATGNVTIEIANKTFVVPIVNGTAVLSTDGFLPGNYTPVIHYPGDSKYSAFDTTTKLSIESRIIINASDLTKYYGNPSKFIVSVVNSEGQYLSNYTLKVSINNVTYTRRTNSSGFMAMNINLPSNTYNVSVTGGNGMDTAIISILPTVNGTDLVKVFRNGTHYWVTLRDSNGSYLTNGSQVEFNIHGVFYTRSVKGNDGLVKLNINLEAGTYIITARNLVTGEQTSNNITVLSKIQGSDLTKYYRNGTQYVVQLLSDNGKPVGAGETITFNINGVFYTKTSNSTGHVKLNINLNPGDYIITGEYKGCKASNNIKVLPVLTANDLTKKYGSSNQFVVKLVDGTGKAYPNQKISFNINGVFYTRTTDANGEAKLNINLQAGQYIITSTYNSASISNKITITG